MRKRRGLATAVAGVLATSILVGSGLSYWVWNEKQTVAGPAINITVDQSYAAIEDGFLNVNHTALKLNASQGVNPDGIRTSIDHCEVCGSNTCESLVNQGLWFTYQGTDESGDTIDVVADTLTLSYYVPFDQVEKLLMYKTTFYLTIYERDQDIIFDYDTREDDDGTYFNSGSPFVLKGFTPVTDTNVGTGETELQYWQKSQVMDPLTGYENTGVKFGDLENFDALVEANESFEAYRNLYIPVFYDNSGAKIESGEYNSVLEYVMSEGAERAFVKYDFTIDISCAEKGEHYNNAFIQYNEHNKPSNKTDVDWFNSRMQVVNLEFEFSVVSDPNYTYPYEND